MRASPSTNPHRKHFGEVDPSYSRRRARKRARDGRRASGGIPATFQMPDPPKTCDYCEGKRKAAEKPSRLSLPDLLIARNVLTATPPYGPKVRVTFKGGQKAWICPRCFAVPDGKGGTIPLVVVARTRDERRAYFRTLEYPGGDR